MKTVAKPKPKGTARHPRPVPAQSPRASSSPPTLRDVLVTGTDEEWRAHTRKVLVEGAPAPATQSARQCAWRQWGLFSKGSGKEARLYEDFASEELALDFVAHLAFVRRLKFSTIKGKIGQLNAMHVQRGWGAPFDSFARVRQAL